MSERAFLSVANATVRFDRSSAVPPALDSVSVDVAEGTTLGIVGESGSGKSTLAKAIVGSVDLSEGSISLRGDDITRVRGRARWNLHRRVQLIPQNPYSSLNPRRTIGAAIAEAIDPLGRTRASRMRDRIEHWLKTVHLPVDAAGRYPHEFSGGQRQRIAIARALAISPELVIADEITSALDATVQKEVLALVAELQSELGFTMLFISHNLAVVQEVSDDVLVLYRGTVAEYGTAREVFDAPKSDYTRTLLASVPGLPGFTLG